MAFSSHDVASALAALPDQRQYDHFQEIAFHLAKKTWPRLHLTHKVHDRGADAIDEVDKLILACGWNGDLRKLKGDCASIDKERPGFRRVVFATSLKLSEQQRKSWEQEVKNAGFELVSIIHWDWIVGELTRPENWWIAHRYLDMPVGNFADLVTHLPRLKEAAYRVLASWKAEYFRSDQPHLDLRIQLMSSDQAETNREIRVSEIHESIHCGDVSWLTGQPGIGKTRSMLDLAESCLVDDKRIPLLLSLRRWAMQDQSLLDYLTTEPALRQQGIEPTTLATAIESGDVILLINGWNEIPNERQEKLKGEFSVLLGQLGGATIVVSSRARPMVQCPRFTHHWRICELNDGEISDALLQAKVPVANIISKQIVDSWQLAQIARIPLFLWELAAQTKSGQPLSMTRFDLLDRMVNRACSEHRDALRIEGQSGIAPRFLGALAMGLTDHGQTGEKIATARQVVAETTIALQKEALLATPPAPMDVLAILASCHLLVLDDGNTAVRFSHHLVQEYFAAQALALQVESEGAHGAHGRLSLWAWAVPIQLCVEHLVRKGRHVHAASLVEHLAEVDLEAACRAIGSNPELWELGGVHIDERIRSLVASADVNARWIAARCAAATGQSTFAEVVFEGLAGHPVGSGDVYVGLPSEIVFRSLGKNFANRLLACNNEDFRFRVLSHLAATGSHEGIRFAREVASSDAAPLMRRYAYELLFAAGHKESWPPFLTEVRRQGGWDTGLLQIVKGSPSLPIACWRKLQRRLVVSKQDLKERREAYNRWANSDHDGAYPYARTEYEWCLTQSSDGQFQFEEGSTIRDHRLSCLRRAAVIDPQWAAERTMEELAVPGFDKLGAVPREVLSGAQKARFVEDRIERTVETDRRGGDAVKLLARVAPESVARWILHRVTAVEFPRLSEEYRWSITDALRTVERSAQLAVACEGEFEYPDKAALERLIDTLMRGRGNQHIVLSDELGEIWRQRLGRWMALFPLVDHESAYTWSNLAILLGEVGRSDDAPLLIELLNSDEAQVRRRMGERLAIVEAYRASGGRTKKPGGIDACSYKPSYHQALSQLKGNPVAQEVEKLLSDPREVAFAGNWLATHLGAPSGEDSGFGINRYRYDLISERRYRTPESIRASANVLGTLKRTIDRQLEQNSGADFQELGSSLYAIARLEGGPSGSWIVDRLERHFPESAWDGLLHGVILVGAEVPGRRLLPFVQRTIHEALNPKHHPAQDQTWRVWRIVTALFYTDAPELGIQLLGNDAEPIFPREDRELQGLMTSVRWSPSHLVDKWLRTFFEPSMLEQLRSTAMQVTIDRVVDRKSFDDLPDLARQFVELGDLRHSEGAWTISSKLADLIVDHTGLQASILAMARMAPTIDHARRWLDFIRHIGAEESILVAFDLTEQWGEADLDIVSSLYPGRQDGRTLGFHGNFANWRRTFHRLPNVLVRLRKMTDSSDQLLRDRAQRALHWLERERLGGGL